MFRILVIDDDKSLRENIAEILEYGGYKVLKAEHGAMGLQLAQDAMPDLIICDIVMPHFNGYEVIQELHRNPTTAVIPFLFLTSKHTYDSIRQGMDLGADDYLTKPFVVEELLSAVQARLEKHARVNRRFEQQFDELRGNLITILPHELRTPLGTILGYGDLILMDIETMDKDDIERMVETIVRSGRRLQRVIENYLLYAQTEIQHHDLQAIETFSKRRYETPGTLIREVARQTARTFERDRDLVLQTHDVPVQIDGNLLKKIVEELVSNALKFSASGTQVHIIAAPKGDHYGIEISDQGRGMTAEQVSRIGAYMQFERKLYEQQGMGLGLILAKRLAELHGADMSIRSVPGEGTTIFIALRLPI